MKRGRNQRRRQGGQNPNRALDSNGPDVRIRGTANQIYDKYQALARDASSSGDRVKAENYLQHAEHYFRLIKSMQPAAQPTQPQSSVDADGDQPQIEDEKTSKRRTSEGADADDAPAKDESDAGDSDAKPRGRSRNAREKDAEAEGGQDGDDSEKKPRRKRARRTPQAGAEETDETTDKVAAS
ncbi:MAG: DUF4167 domain-containing protein [Pseudomonadota bacterium]